MINLAFEKGDEKRMTGYSKREISVETKIVKEVSESELNGLVPDSFEGDWKENRAYFKLDSDGEIVFDESYEPQREDTAE